MGRRDTDDDKPSGLEALRRRTSSSSRTSPSAFNRRVSSQSSRTTSSTTRRDSIAGSETPPPLMRSSPSVGSSSYGFSAGSSVLSPLRRELELTRSRDGGDIRAGKLELAHRLSMLAQRLTYGDSMEELVALDSQVNQLEQALGGGISPSVYGSPPLSRKPRPLSLETPVRKNRGSDMDGSAIFSSPSSLFRTRFADQLSPTPSSAMLHHDESEEEEAPPPKAGMTPAQANKVISEMLKLKEEFETIVTNLKARQEESDVSFWIQPHWASSMLTLSQHIHRLLVERAERAAQRIIFLQNRITYL